MTSKEIRQQFLDFFASKEHTIVESSPVVPLDDPTLMFTNAGMNQFKDVFLGTGSREYTRVADTQKCIRAGGKHNDLDDVGQDTYHHTFFEMLGNWSFGDYFKKEAILWAWELLTEVWGIEKDRLHATYFEGDEAEGLKPDSEASELWRTVTDMLPANIHPGNKKDNFWEMGDTGPCGPCSEVHIDLTPDKSGASLVNAGDARVIELWNLVFIQFNRASDGKLTPLPAKHVDTGMGFERLVAVLTGKMSNYDTDVWTLIFDAIQKRTGAPEYRGTLPTDEVESVGSAVRTDSADPSPERERREDGSVLPTTHDQLMTDVSYRVIADHARCLTFALTDGAVPSNEGRGYVLRRILRRAVRYGRQYFDMHEPFLCDLIEPLVAHMADAFPELRTAHGGRNIAHVTELIRDEEASFIRTLDRGIKLFNEAAEYARKRHHGKITGDAAFKLHDTYGFPVDLTELMAEESGLTIDIGEYERLMEESRSQARAAADKFKGVVLEVPPEVSARAGRTDDSFKYSVDAIRASQVAVVVGGMENVPLRQSEEGGLAEGTYAGIALDKTCFYAEQGGQAGDTGSISTETGTFEVETTQMHGDAVLHFGHVVRGHLLPSQEHTLEVALDKRELTAKNHTSTHMLNWALREVLGDHVQQKGSAVDPEKARFDFSHNRPLTDEELARTETLVNEMIESDLPVYTMEAALADAQHIKTLRAVFGEKYADPVRVVSVGADVQAMLAKPDDPEWMKYPVEFCGGTHLTRSSEAERFVLISEENVAKGVRRVVGITTDAARQAEATGKELLSEARTLADQGAAQPLNARITAFQQKVNKAVVRVVIYRELQRLIADLQKKAKAEEKQAASETSGAIQEQVASLLASAETVGDVKVVVGEVPAADPNALRSAIDWVRNKTEASAILLASVKDDKVTLIAGISKSVVKKGVKAGDLIKEIAPLVGGRGGGRPDMAQGGGTDPSKLPDALTRAQAWIKEKLG